MKYKEKFQEILDSMKIKKICIDYFTPEQIFYQLEDVAGTDFEDLRKNIEKNYKKFLEEEKRRSKLLTKEDDSISESGSGGSESDDIDFDNQSSECSITNEDDDDELSYEEESLECSSISDSEEDISNSSSDDQSHEFSISNEDEEELSNEDESLKCSSINDSEEEMNEECSGPGNEEEDSENDAFESEETVKFEQDDWDAFESSFDSIINQPASKTIAMLCSKNGKENQSKNNRKN